MRRDLTPRVLLPAHLPNFRRKFVPRPSLGKTKQRSPEYSDRRKPVPTRRAVAAPAMRRANSYHVYAIIRASRALETALIANTVCTHF